MASLVTLANVEQTSRYVPVFNHRRRRTPHYTRFLVLVRCGGRRHYGADVPLPAPYPAGNILSRRPNQYRLIILIEGQLRL